MKWVTPNIIYISLTTHTTTIINKGLYLHLWAWKLNPRSQLEFPSCLCGHSKVVLLMVISFQELPVTLNQVHSPASTYSFSSEIQDVKKAQVVYRSRGYIGNIPFPKLSAWKQSRFPGTGWYNFHCQVLPYKFLNNCHFCCISTSLALCTYLMPSSTKFTTNAYRTNLLCEEGKSEIESHAVGCSKDYTSDGLKEIIW